MDSPLGEARELYRVALDGTLGRIEAETSAAAIIFTAAQLAPLGAGSATLSVQQLGDFATSRAATLPITLS
ncbi:hypothetical protein [Sphingomonas sp.]|uniref:hypothetical protein n=1 Tax=Sphingomonas sp. TaxID=28214 RepID=UPI0017D7CAE1|nr:hypothetical protein [Sphingomonas sp.]MBA3512412.1 hypothetical protein [Sphingomonas sp.]